MDRGIAAGGDRAARPAFAARDRCHDRAGLSGAGARAIARHPSGDIPSAATGRDFHRTYRLSRHADAFDRSRAEGMDGAWGKRRARRHPEAGDGHQPRRQQRRDESCRAGSARAARAARRHHGMVALRRAARDCFRRKNCATAFMAARSRRRSCWRAIRNTCAGCDRRLSPRSIAMEKDYRWLSTHRPAPFAWQAQDLHASGAAGDATLASADKGEQPARSWRAAFCELLADVDKFDLADADERPEGLTAFR